MGIEIFRKENRERWMNDEFIRQDTRRMDRYKDKCLLEYIAIYSEPHVSKWAVKALGMSAAPDSIDGILANNERDKENQRWAVLHEQVMREYDYWTLEAAAYEASHDMAWFAFCRLTGCSCAENSEMQRNGLPSCGLKQGMSRTDIEQFCRGMIENNGRFSRDAADWLSQLAYISDEELEEWARPKTERSWDNDPTERFIKHYKELRERDMSLEDMIRSIYDAYIFWQYSDIHIRSSALIMDETLDMFGKQVVEWYERRHKRPVGMTTSVRNVLIACGPEDVCAALTDERICDIAYTETKDKRGHSYYIGLDHLYGFCMDEASPEAARLLTDAAEAGNKYAVEELIDIYEEGIGVKKNPWLAKKWREKYEDA